MKYFAIVCVLVSFTVLSYAMEPALVAAGSNGFVAGAGQMLGVLSDGNKVVVNIHVKSLRGGNRWFFSGKIGKKGLNRVQAQRWLKKLMQGPDYTVRSEQTPYLYSEQ